jgi:hypothetical protein
MLIKEVIKEDVSIQSVGQPNVEDLGEPLGVMVSAIYSIGGQEYTVTTYRDFEEDLGPLMQISAGGATKIQRPAPRTGHYTTHIFDRSTDGDMVATIETSGDNAKAVTPNGSAAYHMKPDLAMSLYRKHFATAKPWLDSQPYPEWARTGYEDYNQLDEK